MMLLLLPLSPLPSMQLEPLLLCCSKLHTRRLYYSIVREMSMHAVLCISFAAMLRLPHAHLCCCSAAAAAALLRALGFCRDAIVSSSSRLQRLRSMPRDAVYYDCPRMRFSGQAAERPLCWWPVVLVQGWWWCCCLLLAFPLLPMHAMFPLYELLATQLFCE